MAEFAKQPVEALGEQGCDGFTQACDSLSRYRFSDSMPRNHGTWSILHFIGSAD
jgi:hypothetical protein